MAVAVAAALLSALPAARADNIRIGDWRLGDYIGLNDDRAGTSTAFALESYTEKPTGTGGRRDSTGDVAVHCHKDQWVLRVMEICWCCGPSRQVPVLVSIDGAPSFEVIATITDNILTDPPGQPGTL